MLKRIKLFHKFALIMVLLVVIPLLIQGIKMININREALEVSVLETHTKLAQAIAEDINDYVSGLNLDLAFVLAFEKFPKMSWQEKMKILLSVLSRHEDFILISVLNGNGDEVIKVHNPSFLQESSRLISRSKDQAFVEAKKTGAPQVGNIYYDGNLSRINVVYPLEADYEYVFVTATLSELWRKIDGMRIGKTGFAFLIDSEGRTIFHPELEKAKNFEKAIGLPIVRQALAQFGNPSGVNISGEGFRNENGSDFVGAYAWAESLNWGVIMQQSKGEAYSSITRMKVNAIFWIVLSILGSVFIAFYLAKSLSRPILELIAGAERLGEGDFSHEVKVKTHDEISTLANTFNFMVRKLKEFQEQLVLREKLAALGQMASVVGHEIRNPLGVINNAIYYIKTRLEMPSGKNPDPKIQKHIGIIEKEIAASDKIINDLLGFSRTRPPMAQSLDLNKIVEDSLSVISIPETVKVEIDLSLELPPALVNPDEIRQVFINLINNAWQAMPEGGTLKIRTYIEEEMAQVEISDTGCGISPENMKKLFTPFFSTKTKGTGLGLAAVQRIVERHKGKIKVRSRVGQGTTFIVSLPLAK
jgi:two-component system NtrC family sensor kinase